MQVVGVGCLWFAPSHGYIEDGKEGQITFLSQVKAELEKIENITNVIFDVGFEKPYGNTFIIGDDEKDAAFVPVIYGANIAFDIFLPFRVQEELFEKADVENFRVVMAYGYYSPITYVQYNRQNGQTASPSTAVVVLRKFLEKKLAAGPLLFGCVGPSPFHANFLVVEDEHVNEPSLVDVSPDEQGYATLEIRVPSIDTFDVRHSMERHTAAFSTFYELSNLRSKLIRLQVKTTNKSMKLLEMVSEGRIGEVVNAFKIRTDIDDLRRSAVYGSLTRADIDRVLLEVTRQEAYPRYALKRFFDKFLKSNEDKIFDRLAKVAEYFEDRRQKMFANLSVLVGGLCGGLIGGLVGSVATYILTR